VTLVIDNYDSFTYNLVQMVEALGEKTVVVRNDAWTVDECLAARPDRVIISPGPGRPESAGISVALIQALPATVPVLGVCLGHQAIALAFGGTVGPAVRLMHGKADRIQHNGEGILAGLSNPFTGGRYHSLAVTDVGPGLLRVTAWASDGTVMAVQHVTRPVYGIQFHPESILTPEGPRLMANFLEVRDAAKGAA
jgi:anthranilate synthase component 2